MLCVFDLHNSSMERLRLFIHVLKVSAWQYHDLHAYQQVDSIALQKLECCAVSWGYFLPYASWALSMLHFAFVSVIHVK